MLMIKLGEIVNIPRNVKEIEVLNATVQFYEDGVSFGHVLRY